MQGRLHRANRLPALKRSDRSSSLRRTATRRPRADARRRESRSHRVPGCDRRDDAIQRRSWIQRRCPLRHKLITDERRNASGARSSAHLRAPPQLRPERSPTRPRPEPATQMGGEPRRPVNVRRVELSNLPRQRCRACLPRSQVESPDASKCSNQHCRTRSPSSPSSPRTERASRPHSAQSGIR